MFVFNESISPIEKMTLMEKNSVYHTAIEQCFVSYSEDIVVPENVFCVSLVFFHFCVPYVFTLGVLYPEHSQLAFDLTVSSLLAA